jgi:putative ABC transport system ATP-binding protein
MRVELHNISLRLGGKPIFQNFSLMLEEGEKVLLKGPSGSGKSSLLRLVLGFVMPDKGRVLIDGEALKRENVWALRRRMAFVPQEWNVGSGTVEAFIREIFSYRANQHLKYEEEQVLAQFAQFELEAEKLTQAFSKLSGGEKQRISLVIALLLDRELYLLDEATSAMDRALRDKVIAHLAGQEGKTMIIVSHDEGWKKYGFRELMLSS